MSAVARTHRDFLGSVFGLLVFLGGIALLLLTFRFAFQMFETSPEKTLQIKPTQAINLAVTGSNLVGVLLRTLLLIVMAFVSSLIANRGISLYHHSLVREKES
jgi:hypothetical protein